MATQTVLFAAASGLTITAARLFSGTSDTIAATAAATEQTNAKGWYSAAYTDLAAGLYRVVALDANNTTLAIWWVRCAGGNSTAFATETPDATEWTLARAGYMDLMLQADNGNQRTVQVNGNRHIAAAVHTCEDNSITAAAIADSAVAEIQSGLATLDNQRFQLSIMAGAIANAATSAELYVFVQGGSTYTVTFAGLDAVGNRGTASLVKT